MRNDLYRLAQVVAFTLLKLALAGARVNVIFLSHLLLDDFTIDLSSCDVVVFGQGHVQVSLIVSKIQICFTSVVEHKDFA